MTKRGKVILLHFVGQMPLAGIAWQAMHYLVGLQRLGYDVWYIEDGGANPYDPRVASVMMDCGYNVGFLRRSMESHGLGGRWAYWDAIHDEWHGLTRDHVQRLYREADGLINLCGATQLRDEHLACPIRIMVDSDPIYEQIKYAKADPAARAYLDAHTHFFSYGENLGSADCPVPLSGLDWRPTRPPVVIDLWPETVGRAAQLFDDRHLGKQRQEHRVRRVAICLVETPELLALSRSSATTAGDLLQLGDGPAGC